MSITELLQGQYRQSHQVFLSVVGDVPPELMNARDGHGTCGSIGSIFAHVAMSEDMIGSGLVGEPTLYESGNWAAKLGVPLPGIFQTPEWAAAVELKAGFEEYAAAVFARTEAIVGGMSEADLDRLIEGITPNPAPARMFVANIGLIHVNEHAGEIAALKGVHGLKGLGF